MITIHSANLRDASWITANLRQLDREEAYCQVPEGTPNTVVAAALVSAGGLIAYIGDDPVMLFGTTPMTICAMSAWALGTERMERAIPVVSRYLIETHIPQRLEQGFNNMEARSLVTHGAAHRWMESMGGVRDGNAYLWGRNGEHFITYRWTVSSYRAISGSRWSTSVPERFEP